MLQVYLFFFRLYKYLKLMRKIAEFYSCPLTGTLQMNAKQQKFSAKKADRSDNSVFKDIVKKLSGSIQSINNDAQLTGQQHTDVSRLQK